MSRSIKSIVSSVYHNHVKEVKKLEAALKSEKDKKKREEIERLLVYHKKELQSV